MFDSSVILYFWDTNRLKLFLLPNFQQWIMWTQICNATRRVWWNQCIANFLRLLGNNVDGTSPVDHSVDGNPANQLRLIVYPIICRVLYILGGAGFLPSTVVKHSKQRCLVYFDSIWRIPWGIWQVGELHTNPEWFSGWTWGLIFFISPSNCRYNTCLRYKMT